MGFLSGSDTGRSLDSTLPDNSHRPRCRELGIEIGIFPPGEYNAITDVAGVKVGHSTIWRGEGKLVIGEGPVRTGVTVILPHDSNTIKNPLEAASYVFNGAGTTTSLACVDEYGLLETPILLTNTLSVGTAYNALVRYIVENYIEGPDDRSWFAPVVGETCDGFLNDIHGLHVRVEHVYEAIKAASSGPVAEGAVGAGTGVRTCNFKAGIGTSSRVLKLESSEFTIGVLVQSNVPGTLVVDGVPVGKELGVVDRELRSSQQGSIMGIIATDLPLDSRQLKRLAARCTLGMARIGVSGSHGSGDFFIAFSTTYRPGTSQGQELFYRPRRIKDENFLTPAFAATADAVEEAILNSIFKAVTVVGRDGNTVSELDLEKTLEIMRKYGKTV
jgi:D-aminopeptidase